MDKEKQFQSRKFFTPEAAYLLKFGAHNNVMAIIIGFTVT